MFLYFKISKLILSKHNNVHNTDLPVASFHFLKTFIQGQVMPNRILPASWRSSKVREAVQNPAINFFDGQTLAWRVLDRHVDEEAEGVRGLGCGGLLFQTLVARRPQALRVIPFYVIQRADDREAFASEAEVGEEIGAFVEPIQVRELLIGRLTVH